MAQGKGTPKKFKIPALDDVYSSDAVLVRPLFKPSGPVLEQRTEGELAAGPAGVSYADYLIGQRASAGPSGAPASGRSEGQGTTSATEQPARAVGVVAAKVAGKLNSILVSPRQRGNPILKFVRNVPWEFGDAAADYILGNTTCALYISLRYHCLHPDYIHQRLKALGQGFALRLLLVHVDVKDPHHELKELAKISLLADCTLILAWSCEEAGHYLETYKAFENKPADILKERVDHDFLSKVTDCLTTVKSVNKTDSLTLLNTFKSLGNVIEASREELSFCPGLGPQKARRLIDVFHEPFLRSLKPDPRKPST